MTATATILARLLTLPSVTSNRDSKLKTEHDVRIDRIAKLAVARQRGAIGRNQGAFRKKYRP